jgi:protein gp37
VLDWVICGGESAGQARPMQAEWARSLRDQCAKAGVPFFFKQWGTLLPAGQAMADGRVWEPLCGSPLRGTKSITGHLLDGVEIRQFPKALS